ncbi:expressed unknown protein [Seminavis robusta]|uniref:RXYLT1 C-terminal domain-containing protein n=1 Tax=Seminavis robusta TaxID=568900 RepID=A0A9N8DEE9_9STRA|nr:expressed unknown protein [Seminavis robusta]|eukprot:Sro33_g021210.1 n/a (476) ;mRNA; r:12520-13947
MPSISMKTVGCIIAVLVLMSFRSFLVNEKLQKEELSRTTGAELQAAQMIIEVNLDTPIATSIDNDDDNDEEEEEDNGTTRLENATPMLPSALLREDSDTPATPVIPSVLPVPVHVFREDNHTQVISTISQNQRDFYDYHYQQMQELFGNFRHTNVIYWATRQKFEQFLQHFDQAQLWRVNKTESRSQILDIQDYHDKGYKYLKIGSICILAKNFNRYRRQLNATPYPHIAFFRMDENWGGFSQQIPGKTTDWVPDLMATWKKEGCKNSTIWEYINHPETLLAVTTQFQLFGDHPKVHSLPLGVRTPDKIKFMLDFLDQHHQQPRTQLLMLNCKGRPMRKQAMEAVIRNFQGTVRNTFGKGKAAEKSFFEEMMRSKFILSPGGLGLDCYRHWEAMYLGTIPVIEHLNRTDGWYRSFQGLPVAWIDSHDNVTPEWLEQEYQRIIAKAKEYRYERLTAQHWIQFIKSFWKNNQTKEIL